MEGRCNHTNPQERISARPNRLSTSKPHPRSVDNHREFDQGKIYRAFVQQRPRQQNSAWIYENRSCTTRMTDFLNPATMAENDGKTVISDFLGP